MGEIDGKRGRSSRFENGGECVALNCRIREFEVVHADLPEMVLKGGCTRALCQYRHNGMSGLLHRRHPHQRTEDGGLCQGSLSQNTNTERSIPITY